MTERRRVLVACCNGNETFHKDVAEAAFHMRQDPRHEVKFIAPTKSPYVNNLHHTVWECLDGKFEYLLIMDDDNPPNNNPLDLVELDLDVVGFPTPIWHADEMGDIPYLLNVMREVDPVDGFRPICFDEGFKDSGIQRVDAVGTGCVLIASRVLSALMAKAKGNPLEMPFMRRWCPDRGTVTMGNDFAFCQRARAAGFRIWAHFDYQCKHYNKVELMTMIRYMSSIKKTPAKANGG